MRPTVRDRVKLRLLNLRPKLRREYREYLLSCSRDRGAWPNYAVVAGRLIQHRGFLLDGGTFCAKMTKGTSTGDYRTLIGYECRRCRRMARRCEPLARAYRGSDT